MVIFHSFLYVYQRVLCWFLISPMIFPSDPGNFQLPRPSGEGRWEFPFLADRRGRDFGDLWSRPREVAMVEFPLWLEVLILIGLRPRLHLTWEKRTKNKPVTVIPLGSSNMACRTLPHWGPWFSHIETSMARPGTFSIAGCERNWWSRRWKLCGSRSP